MDKTSYRILTLTVGCMLFLSTTAQRVIAWPCPPCPDCHTCTPTGCEPYGNCWGGCPSCESCVSCWCQCTSECGCGGKSCTGCCECSGCSCVGGDCPPCHDCNTVTCECEYQCDPDDCETCVDGSCQVCGGDPNETCCDGTCTPKCEDGEPTGECDTSHNAEYECVGCVLIGDCSNYTMREYYGSEVSFCNGGGCTDCLQLDAVECYVVYECKRDLQWGRSCQTVLGYDMCVTQYPWSLCEGCTKNKDESEPIVYRYPTRCR